MSKAKVLFSVTKKATKKLLKGDLQYKGMGVHKLAGSAIRYGVKFGPTALMKRAKTELVSIDRHVGNTIVFKNGLVSGVEPLAIKTWYSRHAKPLTVVIPSYNDYELLKDCIGSIKKTTNPKYVRVIIVDDYCQPENRKLLETLEDDQVTVIYREQNGGFAKAVNTGLKATNAKHDVILLNSDTVAHKGWVEAMQYGAYVFGEDVGIVGPKLLYPDGRIQSAGSYRNTEAPEWFDHYYRFQDSNYGPANVPQYCIAVTGACMYIKRGFLNKVGILDDEFQFAFEDVDWCLRGWESGYRTLYFPAATLTHVESASRPKNKTISAKEKQSIKYFWEKWGDWFDKRDVKNAKGQTRIIFVLQTLGHSGGIKIVFEHANKLSQKGFDIEIWGLDTHDCPWEIGPNVRLRTFKNYKAMIAALTPEKAIKVATWWETAFPVWLSSIKNGIPVYFIQEFETWFYPGDVQAQATVVACYRKEFKNMTTSQYNLEEIKALGLHATAIPCGYDEQTYKPLANVTREDNVLLAVGRRFFQKNFTMTFKGWKAMAATRPKMWLYGIEPDMAKMDSRIKYFTEPTNDEVNELYNRATVFVQTSRHEGFSLPILEAMAAGMPVISTNTGGLPEVNRHGVTGMMSEMGDIQDMIKNTIFILESR